MKVVHTAGSEVEAVMIQGILESAGIPVVLRPQTMVPGYDEALESATGVWGKLLVPDDAEAEARELIAEYLASLRDEARDEARP